MLSMLRRFVTLPRPVQAALCLACGGGLLMAAYMFLPSRYLIFLVIGVAVVAVLLVGYRALLKRGRKRKAAQMERSLSAHSATAPAGAAEPAARARMDDMRRSFEEGITKFRAVGKNLYELPWYVIVGESGSGKTEAIRHCNIGFPPGLQDRLQGVGGTLSMNWWFTDNAVLLDTAGRLMFEDTASGEWRQFLKLLNDHRMNCPINGMLLVIPADSLITDTAEQIEAKGSKIAQQLDHIQRELGVRFPVFVVVTKCDLINGFREFFDNVRDPELQHQILGWSNPDPLDQPFNPEQIDEHIQTVMERLNRRRLRLLMDPVHTESTAERRTDQVDSLYAFPQGLSRIIPRLKRYLEMVFVAGAWSARPLFLRGIYFTSAMREGSALDEELSEMLNVPVESLPEGHVWAEDRAYFLRDVFTKKVFRERGLVTRATNARKSQRNRRAAVLGVGFVAVLAMFAFTWFGASTLARSIGGHRDLWAAAARADNWKHDYWRAIVDPEFADSTNYMYLGKAEQIELSRTERMPLETLHGELLRRTSEQIDIPWIFGFASTVGKDINTNRIRAHRKILTASVLRPVADAARRKMTAASDGAWTPEGTTALVQLLHLETRLVAPADDDPVDLDPLFKYALIPAEYQTYDAGGSLILNESLDWSFRRKEFQADQQGWAWLCPVSGAGGESAHEAIDKGLERLINHWSKLAESEQSGEDAAMLKLLQKLLPQLNEDLLAYRDMEMRLLQLPDDVLGAAAATGPTTLKEANRLEAGWTDERFKALRDAESAIAEHMREIRAALETVGVKPARNEWLVRAYREVSGKFTQRKKEAFEDLMAALPAADADGDSEQWRWLKNVRERIEAAQRKLEADITRPDLEAALKELDRDFFAAATVNEDLRGCVADALEAAGSDEEASQAEGPAPSVADRLRDREDWPLYEVRFAICALADAQLAARDDVSGPESLAGAIEGAEKEIRQARADADSLWLTHQRARGEDVAKAGPWPMTEFADFAFDRLIPRKRLHHMLARALGKDRPDMERIQELVADAARGEDLGELPVVPMTRGAADVGAVAVLGEYHPRAAGDVLGGLQAVGARIQDPNAVVLNREDLEKVYAGWQLAAAEYTADYLKFWTETLPSALEVQPCENWRAYRSQLREAAGQTRQIRSKLRKACSIVDEAMKAVAPSVPADGGEGEKLKRTREQLAEALDDLEDRDWRNELRDVMDTWQELPADVQLARDGLLVLMPSRFLRDYTMEGPDDPVVKRYLASVPFEGLSVLADESQKVGREAWERICRELAKFPLVRPGSDDQADWLTKEQLAEACKLLALIGRQHTTADGTGGETIGDGARTSDARINEQLARLSQLQLPREERQLVNNLQDVAAVLDTREPGEGQLWVLGLEDQPQKDFFHYWAGGIEAVQGTSVRQRVAGFGDEAVRIGKIRFGGRTAALSLRVYRFPGAAAAAEDQREITLAGPWAILRLLHEGRQAGLESTDPMQQWSQGRRQSDGRFWHVILTVDAGGAESNRTIGLGIELPKVLPRIEDWPAPSDFSVKAR